MFTTSKIYSKSSVSFVYGIVIRPFSPKTSCFAILCFTYNEDCSSLADNPPAVRCGPLLDLGPTCTPLGIFVDHIFLTLLCTTLFSGVLQIFYAWTRSPEVIEVWSRWLSDVCVVTHIMHNKVFIIDWNFSIKRIENGRCTIKIGLLLISVKLRCSCIVAP